MNSELWHSIKKKLRIRINPILVRVWVDPLSAHYEDGVVQITAPNEFVMNWVEEHLLSSIKDAAQEVLDEDVGITIAVRENAEKEPSAREFLTDVSAYYAVDDIVDCINRLRDLVRTRTVIMQIEKREHQGLSEEPDLLLEDQSFDAILDAVLEAFSVDFREIMVQETDHAELARRALYYLCFRYDIPPEEVALNMDCTVSEVKLGAAELEREISFAVDNGEDLDELLMRLFRKE
ncbi:DnaA N-terminal domain-containing protein [Maridesulfovibrio frigidus]|uniref:DnaA N-terminal domain-containing protein n=1 Tax=Maridesulfovibrio frigidus TaxID=340956 RepID=UPI0004E121FF|nr:DnaA N-terminal domain-containing protein [Maridesulfovibrio frigidus]